MSKKTRFWYSVEELPLDNEGFSKAREIVLSEGANTKVISEELDMKKSCIRLLVKYQVWFE